MDQINELITATGAMTELLGMIRNGLRGSGFSERDTLYLCSVALAVMLQGNKEGGGQQC